MSAWLGVDLGGTWLRWGGDEPGRLRLEDPEPEAVIECLAARAGGRGVAISFAGWLSPDGRRVMQGPNLGWSDVPLVEMAAAKGLRCHLENDLDARAWGEFLALRAPSGESLMVLNAGSGFAMGLVVQGRLLRGRQRRAGEVGHLVLGPPEKECGCGDSGCVEALLGGAKATRGALDDPHYRQRWLALAAQVAAPVITALDPHHVLGVGGVLENRPDLLGELERSIASLLPRRWFDGFRLQASEGESLALLGVVDLARRAQEPETDN